MFFSSITMSFNGHINFLSQNCSGLSYEIWPKNHGVWSLVSIFGCELSKFMSFLALFYVMCQSATFTFDLKERFICDPKIEYCFSLEFLFFIRKIAFSELNFFQLIPSLSLSYSLALTWSLFFSFLHCKFCFNSTIGFWF